MKGKTKQMLLLNTSGKCNWSTQYRHTFKIINLDKLQYVQKTTV